MPEKIFLDLDQKKQSRIIDVACKEFATYGYEQASTNRIVKECGISKGSLFKYFKCKEDLFFFLLDTVASEMAEDMGSGLGNLSDKLFQRIIDYSSLEISWYIRNPVKGRLVLYAFTENDSEIYKKTAERYGISGENIYSGILEGIELKGVTHSKEVICDMFKWVLKGFNKEFLDEVYYRNEPAEVLQEEYERKLTDYIRILKNGL
ncbi:MAG: TetR/AcrR family transcriptional regulator [Clostridiales bacterium]|nr:TetR/AcrR family transcriptional regulator [Clostridiales bacterium]